jgi:hypothetical protein
VSPQSVFWNHPVATVSGKVTYSGHPDLAPLNGPLVLPPRNAVDRANPNHTLNFNVPAAHCVGTVAFNVKIFDPAHPQDAANAWLTDTITLSFDNVPSVRVHGVLIHYTGKGLNIPAPSGIDLMNTLVWVGKTYPISGFRYTGCDVINFNGDLTVGGGGGCGTGWNQLFNTIWNMRAASGTTDVFVGLLPPGVPTSGVIGCGGGGVAIAYRDGGTVLAQEIGHAFGRAHAPCGNPGGPDPNYPTYDSYPSGSIGEFGFDGSNSQVFNPASTFDFMSYCGPVWVSPYTYVGLKGAITASPASAHAERAGGNAPTIDREYLHLNFRMYGDGRVELLPSFHLNGTPPIPGPEVGFESRVSCDLLGEAGLVGSHRCRLTNPHHDPDGPSIELHEILPWSPEIRSIAFRRDGAVVHTLKIEKHAPEVSIQPPKRAKERPGLLALEWSAGKGEGPKGGGPHSYLVRYSNDDGKTWQAIVADLEEPRHLVNLDLLPGGDKCKLQIVASAGVRTATAETESFAVPVKPRQAHILHPKPGTSYRKGQPVPLVGGGFSPDFATTEFDEVVWTSNLDGAIGVGHGLVVNSLSSGRHRISIDIPDGAGGEAAAGVFIEVK